MGDNFDLKKFLTENKLTQINQINEQDEEWSITPSYDWYPQKSIKKKKSYILIEPGRIPLPIYVTNIDEDEVEYETDWQEGNEDYWESEFIGTEMEGLVYDPHTDWFDLDKVLYIKNVGDEVKIYLSKHEELNEQDEDDFNVTPNEEEWNKFEIGDIITVDWINEPHSSGFAERFQNKPFKIADDYENGGSNYYKVVPADKETKELWNKEMYWDFHYVKKNNVKPYYGELSEQDDDEWTVTPDEKEWNQPDIGDEVLINWNEVDYFDVYYNDKWFIEIKDIPFKIVGKEKADENILSVDIYGIAPVDKKYDDIWNYHLGRVLWVTEKALKPYQDSINEQDEDDFNVTPDESHWNELEVGDEVLVDWDMVNDFDIEGDMTWFNSMKNKPFKIIDKMKDLFYGNICGIAPVDEKDKDKWDWEIGGIWWVVEKALKLYQGSVNEEQDDEFNVDASDEWNQPGVGDIVTVDWNEGLYPFKTFNFENKPFKIIRDVDALDSFLVEPVETEDKANFYKVVINGKGWLVGKDSVKPYQGPLNENEDNDDFNVTPDEKEWNAPDVGDIVIVDFEAETDSTHGDVYQFMGVPFKIVGETTRREWLDDKIEWWVEPVREEDKAKWEEVYNQQTIFTGDFWTDKGWSADKDNVKKYIGSISENDDDEFNITPDEKEWNKLGVGDLVTVDWIQVEFDEVFMPFENKPFEIIDESGIFFGKKGDNWLIFPYKEEDKQKWIEMLKKKSGPRLSYGYWINKKNVKPYTGPINEDEDDNDDFNVTPDEEKWNAPDIGSIVKVDFEAETDEHEEVHQFIGVPFEIVGESVKYDSWWVEPYRAKDKAKWKKIKMKWGEDDTYYWTDEEWMAFKRNVKPYEGPINEDEDDNDDFNVTPDEKIWNEPGIGDIVTVDWNEEIRFNVALFNHLKQFINKPFEITQEYTGEYRVFPVRAEDKKKWAEVFLNISYFTAKMGWSANKENVKPYIGPINEEDTDDDFNVTPDEKEWNQPDIGNIVTVDFKKEGARKILHQFNNIPFKIVDETKINNNTSEMWWVEPVRSEDKVKWAEVKARHNKNGSLWYWTSEGWCCFKSNVKPYTDPINEENDEEWNVTPNEEEWNKLDVGSIVTVDFKEETNKHKELYQFNNVPFEIVSEDGVDDDLWYVEPVKAEDKKKWEELYEIYFRKMNFTPIYWTDHGWSSNKENVKQYTGPLNENEEEDDEFTVDASDEWNKLGLDDIVLVDFIGRENIGIEALHQFNNVPFKIVDVDRDGWWVEPVKAEDKKKWKEVKMKYNKNGRFSFWTNHGWSADKENVEPYEG